jgi:hypothetical protein
VVGDTRGVGPVEFCRNGSDGLRADRTYTITHHKAGTRIDTVFTFEPFENSTNVRIEFTLESYGLPPGLLAPMGWAIAGKVRDVISNDLADLKESVERQRA